MRSERFKRAVRMYWEVLAAQRRIAQTAGSNDSGEGAKVVRRDEYIALHLRISKGM